MKFTCPKCDFEFYDRLQYCPECGFDFRAGQKRCPKCRSHIAREHKVCPECGLNFERYAYLVPRVVLTTAFVVLLLLIMLLPWVWRNSPWLHDTGITVDGQLRSTVDSVTMVPLFIHWRTGERYIEKAAEARGHGHETDYMNNLIPLPPEVVFHFDMPLGERVWIISRRRGELGSEWVRIGRWINGHGKYGWVHASNIRLEE